MCVAKIVWTEFSLSNCTAKQASATHLTKKSKVSSDHIAARCNAADDQGAALALACERMCSSLVAISEDANAHGLMAVDRSDINAALTQLKELEEELRNSWNLLRYGLPDFERYAGARAARERKSKVRT